MSKILCPAHEDTRPSLHVYPDGAFCFVCGYSTRTTTSVYDSEKEKIADTLEYINGLPLDTIRGLQFPRDDLGYYILWPDLSFYKKRLFESHKIRYVAPKGHTAPLFSYKPTKEWPLAIVEGEINAISLKKAIPEGLNIVSPGGITQFLKYLDKYLYYNKIYVIVDKDDVGLAYGTQLKEQLLIKGKNTSLVALEKDFNDILVEYGINGIKETLKEKKVDLY